MLSIRPFTEDDYAALTAVSQACAVPGVPKISQAHIRHTDESRDTRYPAARFVGEVAGRLVGYAEARQPASYYAPGRWWLKVAVVPDVRGRGHGRALVARLRQYLEDQEVGELWAAAVEGSAGAEFAARRGFSVCLREPFSRLDVQVFDPLPFAERRAEVEARYSVASAAELLVTDPDARRRWWDLDWAIEQDIPAGGAPTRLDFDVFCRYFEAPWFDPRAWLIARDGDEWVGISALKPTADPETWWTAVTGVVRGHRRQGLALALKLHAIAFARAQGARWIQTENEENNPMLNINFRLGFVEHGALLDLERKGSIDVDDS